MIYLLAQFALPNSRLGEDLLRGAVQLSQETTKAWNDNWIKLIDPSNETWSALCYLGLAIAALSLIFVSLKIAADNVRRTWFFSELAEFMVWPLVILLFLHGNGTLLSQTVMLLRDLGHHQVVQVLDAKLERLTLREALENVTLTVSAQEQIAAIYAECQGESSQAYADCIEEKEPIIDEIISQAEDLNGEPLEALLAWSKNSLQWSTNPVSAFIPSSVIKALMYALQWGFVNILEAALLMTAALAPLAVGLSLLPLGSRALWAWGSGFLGLFGVQLSYNLLVGLAATVVVSTGGQSLNDLGFLTIISVFAPALAILIGGGAGIALYYGLNNHVSRVAQLAMNATAGLTSSIVKVFVSNNY
jgi:hypothetical protein